MDKLINKIISTSIADVVFFMIASTICYLAIVEKISPEQFLWIAWIAFGSFYVHKAQNKPQEKVNIPLQSKDNL